jgi:hypothetical protein
MAPFVFYVALYNGRLFHAKQLLFQVEVIKVIFGFYVGRAAMVAERDISWSSKLYKTAQV